MIDSYQYQTSTLTIRWINLIGQWYHSLGCHCHLPPVVRFILNYGAVDIFIFILEIIIHFKDNFFSTLLPSNLIAGSLCQPLMSLKPAPLAVFVTSDKGRILVGLRDKTVTRLWLSLLHRWGNSSGDDCSDDGDVSVVLTCHGCPH